MIVDRIVSVGNKQSKSIDPFLKRQQSSQYNCQDFVREVWEYLTGEDISEKLTKLVGAFVNRRVTLSGIKGFTKLAHPVSPCFVVMQRTKFVPHVGIYMDGRILHLRSTGPVFELPHIAKSYFLRMTYYK